MQVVSRRLMIGGALGGLVARGARAQTAPAAPPRPAQSGAAPGEAGPLPADRTSQHTIELPGRTLQFSATAGSIRLTDDKNVPQTDIAFVAYQLAGADRATRPVTFAVNGGPGMASGWLQVGAVGPWRVPLGGAAAAPSASPVPQPNAETWLDFTDLVFIDPPGTGYSRILAGEDVRHRLWSVDGDVAALAEMVRRWLDRNDRGVSPKYLLGESYGGFRGPRLARVLQSDEGVGVSGIVLVSPVLDLHNESGYNDVFAWVDRLPSEVAAARALHGPVTRADLADVEQYAATDYLTDLVRGMRDAAAVTRVSERVAALTGLDPALVRRYAGRLDTDVFLHELERTQGRVVSMYDATIGSTDPYPHRQMGPFADPVLDAMKAPVSSAMVSIYQDQLNWRPDGVYQLANDATFRQWDWGRLIGRPESLSSLQAALALDPHLRVLITHGLFDLRTPYFATVRMLNQLPDTGSAERVQFQAYPGGHMFYSQDASRAAFRDAAKDIYGV
jgi:carboxypeptidase C (cathepsin A)